MTTAISRDLEFAILSRHATAKRASQVIGAQSIHCKEWNPDIGPAWFRPRRTDGSATKPAREMVRQHDWPANPAGVFNAGCDRNRRLLLGRRLPRGRPAARRGVKPAAPMRPSGCNTSGCNAAKTPAYGDHTSAKSERVPGPHARRIVRVTTPSSRTIPVEHLRVIRSVCGSQSYGPPITCTPACAGTAAPSENRRTGWEPAPARRCDPRTPRTKAALPGGTCLRIIARMSRSPSGILAVVAVRAPVATSRRCRTRAVTFRARATRVLRRPANGRLLAAQSRHDGDPTRQCGPTEQVNGIASHLQRISSDADRAAGIDSANNHKIATSGSAPILPAPMAPTTSSAAANRGAGQPVSDPIGRDDVEQPFADVGVIEERRAPAPSLRVAQSAAATTQ